MATKEIYERIGQNEDSRFLYGYFINFDLMLKQQFLNTIDRYESISLAEMDEVKLMNRVDTKFAFQANDLEKVLQNVIGDYRVFEIEGTRTPSYESQYFDDTHYTLYHDHHKGKMSRFKVRVRKYVESNLHFLEIKHKFKGRTNKTRIKADRFDAFLSEHQAEFIDRAMNDHMDLQPCLWNSFQRITLVGKELNERLTFDFNIEFKWNGQVEKFDNLIIAELKQERTNRNSPFFRVMKEMAIRPYRLSKYCIGSIELHGKENLKYNRFKKKLLKLKEINDDAA